jgi:SAM-dependent methyltransferase
MEKNFLWDHLRDLPYFRSILRAVEAELIQNVELPHPILDVGCGDGHFASVALDYPLDWGIDLHLPSLREAQSRKAYRAVMLANGSQLPFPEGSFASAISNSVLEHMPELEVVLAETSRVLQPGAIFVFTVPNPDYRHKLSFPKQLRRLRLNTLADVYEKYFMWMSRTYNLFDEGEWDSLLARVGFEIEDTFRYFPPSSLHALEWGHYFGAPCLIPRWIVGKWILAPHRWNLGWTERLVRRYANPEPCKDGTYSFYKVRKL